MNKKIITEKLRIFLDSHPSFKEECEVVYFLAEIRKIIENGPKDETYETLYFYCCWVLHSKLNKNLTRKVLSKKFNKCIDLKKKGGEIQKDLINGQSAFFKLNDFNKELNLFLNICNDLPQDYFKGNKWYKFCELFLENIAECKIDLGVENKFCKIKELVVKKKAQGGYYYQFILSNGLKIPKIKIIYE